MWTGGATRGSSRAAPFCPWSKAGGLAKAWYSDRLEAHWRPKTSAEAEAVFGSLGLDGPFWRM
jgi:hypothetical protein